MTNVSTIFHDFQYFQRLIQKIPKKVKTLYNDRHSTLPTLSWEQSYSSNFKIKIHLKHGHASNMTEFDKVWWQVMFFHILIRYNEVIIHQMCLPILHKMARVKNTANFISIHKERIRSCKSSFRINWKGNFVFLVFFSRTNTLGKIIL